MKTLRLEICMLCSESGEKIPEELRLPELVEYEIKYFENIDQEDKSIRTRRDVIIYSDDIERLRPYFVYGKSRADCRNRLIYSASDGYSDRLAGTVRDENGNMPVNLAEIWPDAEDAALRRIRWENLIQNCKFEFDAWLYNNLLEATINGIPDMVWFKDVNGNHYNVNGVFCYIVKKTKEDCEGRRHGYIWNLPPEEVEKGEFMCAESDNEVMNSMKTCTFQEPVKMDDGIHQFSTYKSPLFDRDGKVLGTVGVAHDITSELMYKQNLIDAANTDGLTGLYNRRYFYEYLNKRRHTPMTLFYMDLDNFKHVNDDFGHAAGDDVLKTTADIIKLVFPYGTAVRLGGDEFALVLERYLDKKEIEEYISELEDTVRKRFEKNGTFVTVSVGTARTDGSDTDIDAFIHEGDVSMYKVKELHHSRADR